MRPQYPIWLFAILLLVAGSAQAADPRCPTVTPDPQFKDFVFDLATGAPRGDVDYDLEDRVRFVFTNRNPFLQYDIRVDTQELQEPALTAFTSLFSILSLVPANTGTATTQPAKQELTGIAAKATQESSARSARGLAPDRCLQARDAARDLLNDAVDDLESLQQHAGALNSGLNAVKAKLSESLTIFESATATCDTLQATRDRLEQTYTSANLPVGLRDYQADYDKLFNPIDVSGTTRFDEIDDAIADAREACRNNPDALADISRFRIINSNLFGSNKLQELTKQRQSLETAVGQAEGKRAEINGILNNPSNLITYRYAGPVENRSRSTVTVKIKKPSDAQFPNTPAYTFAVTFGGPSRFALSVGVANSWLDSPEYEAISGIPLDANGNPEANATVTRVIGLKEDSDYRITPMLILNTRLLDTNVHFSFGLSGKVDNKGFDVEYLGGFSYGFARNRAFVTVGAYNGRVQELQRGFRLGSKLPTEVATAPVRKDREWAPMIAISYRIR